MSRLQRALLVALIQLLLVASLGAVLLVDRARLPRVWALTVPFDPDDPFRGRYVELAVHAEGRGFTVEGPDLPPLLRTETAILEVDGGRLIASAAPDERRGVSVRIDPAGNARVGPLAFYIPEHVADPSRRPEGEELWVEVTVPRKGPPRPIRLGVKTSGEAGEPRPLDL